MILYRTPDHHFSRLEDWPYRPSYTQVDGGPLGSIRMAHYTDGPEEGPVILCLHGEPTWAYLYRKMMPRFAAAGARVIVPDLVGFGQSDKPIDPNSFSYAQMLTWLSEWFNGQKLKDITLFCQDWGGLLGLRLVAAHPELFARVVAANTFLPDGRTRLTDAFYIWRAYSQKVSIFDCGAIVNQATSRGISAGAMEAYNAPYQQEKYKAGPRRLPMLVPDGPNDREVRANESAWLRLERFEKPLLTLFGDGDPVTAPFAAELRSRIPGAAGQPHAIIKRAGHFLQEDAPEELVERTLSFMGLLDTRQVEA